MNKDEFQKEQVWAIKVLAEYEGELFMEGNVFVEHVYFSNNCVGGLGKQCIYNNTTVCLF